MVLTVNDRKQTDVLSCLDDIKKKGL